MAQSIWFMNPNITTNINLLNTFHFQFNNHLILHRNSPESFEKILFSFQQNFFFLRRQNFKSYKWVLQGLICLVSVYVSWLCVWWPCDVVIPGSRVRPHRSPSLHWSRSQSQARARRGKVSSGQSVHCDTLCNPQTTAPQIFKWYLWHFAAKFMRNLNFL